MIWPRKFRGFKLDGSETLVGPFAGAERATYGQRYCFIVSDDDFPAPDRERDCRACNGKGVGVPDEEEERMVECPECQGTGFSPAGIWEPWRHLSISRKTGMPDYTDLICARDLFFPEDAEVIQVFPPRQEHVSVHDTCLHLWWSKDRRLTSWTFQMAVGYQDQRREGTQDIRQDRGGGLSGRREDDPGPETFPDQAQEAPPEPGSDGG